MITTLVHLHNLHQVMDAGSRLLEETIGVSPCISNCGRCCQENTTFCMTIEAINMISYLPSVGNNLRSAVDIAEGWLLEPIKGVTTYNGIPRGLISQQLLAEWKLVTKSPCPFLTSNMECAIYQARPITCRTFGIYRDAMPICPRPQGKGETQTQKAIIDSRGVKNLLNEFREEITLKNPGWIKSGFAPTMLFRSAYPAKLGKYVAENRIASAKLIGVDFSIDLLWQNQVNAQRAGAPMESIMRDNVPVGGRG